ncbi:MAG: hypothetical protein Q8L41_11310 [Anaerolineales bacterium]|nr:hypothetical protein [Anaerolineales bacterium]
MKRVHFLVITVFLSACAALRAPTPTSTPTTVIPLILLVEENPYRPQLEDTSLSIAGIELTSINLLERFDLDPFRVQLRLSGSLPSVCNELRIEVAPPNENFQVVMEVYSLANPNIRCEHVLQQFEASILLGVYSTGRYTVWVNEGLVGDFIMY